MSDENYQLRYTTEAAENLSDLDKSVARRIINKLEWLAENAKEYSHESLSSNWAGYYRIRVGDYRVIYQLDPETQQMEIAKVGHRRDVYDD
jgi:mRNA interferase RelE/StbE